MNNKKRDRISVGGASIILIMLVLALSSFALLAIRSSMNEKRLATKTSKSIKEYYEMDAEAEELYAKIDELSKSGGDVFVSLSKLKEENPVITEVIQGDENVVTTKFSVSRGERSINVELDFDGTQTHIIRWSTRTAEKEGLYEIMITD